MEKKRIIKSLDTLSDELKKRLKEEYPHGYGNSVVRLTSPSNEVYFAVPLDTEDARYMIKVPIPKPKKESVKEVEEEDTEDNYDENGDDNFDEAAGGSYEADYDED